MSEYEILKLQAIAILIGMIASGYGTYKLWNHPGFARRFHATGELADFLAALLKWLALLSVLTFFAPPQLSTIVWGIALTAIVVGMCLLALGFYTLGDDKNEQFVLRCLYRLFRKRQDEV